MDVCGMRIVRAERDGAAVPLVHDATFAVRAGEISALAGESGSGKSLTALAPARLLPPGITVSQGTIRFRGEAVATMSRQRLRQLRGGGIAYIFQDPAESLNPVRRVGGQIAEALSLHQARDGRRSDAVGRLLQRVGLNAAVAEGYPHQFSGGMLQRVMIAMALACAPALLVADEPTTALDVTVQAQILALLRDVRDETGMGIVLITHNLGVVAQTADTLRMMYAGRIIESGPAPEILRRPRHPYTRALLAAVPRLDRQAALRPRGLAGAMPEPGAMPSGCPFHPRCAWTTTRCRQEMPDTTTVDREHDVRCHYWKCVT